jgi:hypothetical protein
MIALGLLESLAAVALETLVLAALLAQLVAAVELGGAAWAMHARIFEVRQAEDLILTALTRAGEGLDGQLCIRASSETVLELAADLDGNGRVDTDSAERTALLVDRDAGERSRLVHRMGRQSMTILSGLAPNAHLVALDRYGATARSTEDITLIGLEQQVDDVAVRDMILPVDRYGLGCR